MTNDNICPYCRSEMQLGYFGGVRYQLEWIPEGEKQRTTMLSTLEYHLIKQAPLNLAKYMPIIVFNVKNLLFQKIVDGYYCSVFRWRWYFCTIL